MIILTFLSGTEHQSFIYLCFYRQMGTSEPLQDNRRQNFNPIHTNQMSPRDLLERNKQIEKFLKSGKIDSPMKYKQGNFGDEIACSPTKKQQSCGYDPQLHNILNLKTKQLSCGYEPKNQNKNQSKSSMYEVKEFQSMPGKIPQREEKLILPEFAKKEFPNFLNIKTDRLITEEPTTNRGPLSSRKDKHVVFESKKQEMLGDTWRKIFAFSYKEVNNGMNDIFFNLTKVTYLASSHTLDYVIGSTTKSYMYKLKDETEDKSSNKADTRTDQRSDGFNFRRVQDDL